MQHEKLRMEMCICRFLNKCKELDCEKAVTLGTTLCSWQARHLAQIHDQFMLHLEKHIGARGYLGMTMASMKAIIDELLARIEGGTFPYALSCAP